MGVGKVIIVDGQTMKEGLAVDRVPDIRNLIEDFGHYSICIFLGVLVCFYQLLIVQKNDFLQLLLVLC